MFGTACHFLWAINVSARFDSSAYTIYRDLSMTSAAAPAR